MELPDKKFQALIDNRKLKTAKAKELAKEWESPRRSGMIDALFAAAVAAQNDSAGTPSVFLGRDTESLVIGIPCPSLAIEYIIAQDCFPLSVVWQVVGAQGLGKSALIAEFGRWFDEAGGGLVLCENETKFNDQWYRSLMGSAYDTRAQIHRCDSLEDWQEHLTGSINAMKRVMIGTAENPGPGRTVPLLFAVDSIMGKQSRDTEAKILGVKLESGLRNEAGEGSAKRGHPLEALLITRYMRTIPAALDNWPFSLVLVNHLKMAADEAGNPIRAIAGGKGVGFQESFEIELKKVGGHAKQIQSSAFQGYPLELICEKNSFGPTRRKVQTRLLWRYEKNPETGQKKQVSWWDWDWSTVWLLNQHRNGEKADPMIRAALRDEIGFHIECPKVGDVENAAWSKNLGMTASDALPWSEVGAAIRKNPQLMRDIRTALSITSRPYLSGDYAQQKAKAIEARR